jgi:tRNA G18 (ribose-2'-O)-methylase SpoU
MVSLNAKQLRTSEPFPSAQKKLKKNPIHIILDNVLDTYNVGAIFRLADAVAAKKIYLCGQTETPPNPKIKKASINTWKWVDWEYTNTTIEAIKNLKCKIKNLYIIAVEQDKKSIPLSKLMPKFPLAIVVGNESYGVSKEVLGMTDQIIELPMYGVNKSLNVMVSCGIVLYKIVEFL